MSQRHKKKSGPTHHQKIARSLSRHTGIGHQEALRRVREAAARDQLPNALDEAGIQEAVLLLASPSATAGMAVGDRLSAWATRARMTLPEFTRAFSEKVSATSEPAREEALSSFVAFSERSDSRDIHACWLYMGAGCVELVHQHRGLQTGEEARRSLGQLEEQVQQHWRALLACEDYEDGYTTAEEVFHRDVWDMPTMAIIAGLPVESLPKTMCAWVRAFGGTATEDFSRAERAFRQARAHRFATDLAEALVVDGLLPHIDRSQALPDLLSLAARSATLLADRHHRREGR